MGGGGARPTLLHGVVVPPLPTDLGGGAQPPPNLLGVAAPHPKWVGVAASHPLGVASPPTKK